MPPSLETCTWLPAVTVPLSVRLVSEVRKSPGVPVSSVMAVMAKVSLASGGVVSTTTSWCTLALTMVSSPAVASTTCTE
ncbi:hypothetical protein [Ramlibacter albus]|uniref:Uncharacterized protein n=1 Tax=Ramlibacter albus TaxID=2079448 RepID=A0A923S5W3_9BURK|nr:hypothetical protein [Ramlibacter albus]MBC5768428.1 hypothetical protein [Ramlibacter albus]